MGRGLVVGGNFPVVVPVVDGGKAVVPFSVDNRLQVEFTNDNRCNSSTSSASSSYKECCAFNFKSLTDRTF